jgi:hypothetical protein
VFANAAHAALYDVKWEGAKASPINTERTGSTAGMRDFVPEALVAVLNERGAQGWELVSIQPVTVEPGHDPPYAMGVQGTNWWSHAYLCVMKRRAALPDRRR